MHSLVLLFCALAVARPPTDAQHRAGSTYRTGLWIGAAGAGAVVAALPLGAGVAILNNDNWIDSEAGMTVTFASLILGAVALEVGAPVALVGARRERRILMNLGLRPTSGNTAVNLGWASYAGQVIYPVAPAGLGGAYLGAVLQHAHNNDMYGTQGRSEIAPGAGVVATVHF
jgi:hypothetical protein